MNIEMNIWEAENFNKIWKWTMERDIKEGFKVYTFYLSDGSAKIFEIEEPANK